MTVSKCKYAPNIAIYIYILIRKKITHDDLDDICGKVKNLCAHICENTKEAYRCKCNAGYKLDENNVTCSPNNGKYCTAQILKSFLI